MTRVLRLLGAFVAAVLATTLVAVVAQTQFVLAALAEVGAVLPVDVWLAATAQDILGLGPTYGAVIALAFLLALPVGAVLRRLLPPLAPLAYPLAAAAGVAAALVLMSLLLGIMPIGGARSALGFALQCVAGAVGGLLFARLARRARTVS